MTQEEIRDKITFNNKKIERLLDPSVFVLQPEVLRLQKENFALQQECEHQFKEGVCIYCGLIN